MTKKQDKDSPIGDVIKKIVTIGVGAAFMTEEAVKSAIGDLPLPKDVLTGLLANAKNIKDEFINGVREELHERISKVNVSQLVDDVLDKYDLEVSATVRFKRKKDAAGDSDA